MRPSRTPRARFPQRLAAFALWAAATAAQATSYSITTLAPPAGTDAQSFDVNNSGTSLVIGSDTTGSASYLYAGGVYTALAGPAGALGVSAVGLNDGGEVVGSFYTELVDDGTGNLVPGPNTGFILSGGSYSSLAYPGATDTYLRGISNSGRYVTGFAFDGSGNTSFVYDRSTATFTAIAGPLPGSNIAQGVTNAGLVVGNRIIPGAPAQRVAFTFDTASGTLSDFQIAGAFDSRYRAVTEAGGFAGWYRDGGGATHGFVGSTAAYETFDVPGAVNTYIEGINEAGWLAGIFDMPDGSFHAFVAQPVPEPGTALLWLAGLAAVGGLARRRRPG